MKEITDETGVDSNVEANTIIADKSSLEIVTEGIKYEFLRDCLLKPLDEILVSKEITSRVEKKDENGEPVKDEETGAVEYDVETTVKEVASSFRKGIVLKMPKGVDADAMGFNVGNTVLYLAGTTKEFDLFKDTVLIQPFNIIGLSNE